MGQVALGLRSLLVKVAIFFVLASLLAWVLGGSLFPRTPDLDSDAVEFDGARWFWRLAPLGSRGEISWRLLRERDGEEPEIIDAGPWRDVAGPVSTGELLFYGARHVRVDTGEWRIVRLNRSMQEESFAMPDRLAVERQLERLRQGLDLQDRVTIEQQRPQIVDPGADDGS